MKSLVNKVPCRGLSVVGNEIAHGDRYVGIHNSPNVKIIDSRAVPKMVVEVWGYSLRIFTGLYDVKGDMIFHGDICEWWNGSSWVRGEIFMEGKSFIMVEYDSHGNLITGLSEYPKLDEIAQGDIEVLGSSLSRIKEERKRIG